ncbi:head-to-tail stopper [Microbacterium phage Typher]|nr:head-to-tail stopper [Microbacterium phage Typher]
MAELIDEEFADWMESVHVRTRVGDGAWGPVYTDEVEVTCNWAFVNRVAQSSDGSTIVSSTQITAGSRFRPTFAEGSLVTLPGDPHEYKVVEVRTWPGGDSQVEVSLV